MFSSRTEWNTTPNQLTALAAAKRMKGEVLLDLSESNPTRCGFTYPEKEILAALAAPASMCYSPEPRGALSARTAIAEYYASRGSVIAPEQVLLTASTSEAYSFIFKLLCNQGDEVVIPKPSYPLLEYLCQLNDTALRQYRLMYDGEWHIDFESLQSAMSGRARAVVLIHPNNPTGSFLKQQEFDRVCALAADHRCAVIVDEVFQPYGFSHNDHRAKMFAQQPPVLLFALTGISKLLGLPQLKLSWIVVSGNPVHTAEAMDRLDIIADTYLSVNTPVQIALPRLLSLASSLEHQIRERVQTNYRSLQTIFLNSLSSVFHVEGGWYAILRFPQMKSDDQWAEEILDRLNIVVQPGHYYGLEEKSCLVLSLLPEAELFHDAAATICKFLHDAGK
ncbi:MAG: pyridoxal phosphate-dependent aminotransferase [Ignavibacteriae bacterium]|nr:MAG: pyridoxal phosphate-dependent aminotransferase [Ignavibacteriota bacterium]